MNFVRDWLKEERRQLVVQHGWVSLLTLLATLATGAAFVGILIVLG